MKSLAQSFYKTFHLLLLLLPANFSFAATTLLTRSSVTISPPKRTTLSYATTTPAPSLRAPQLQLRHHTIPSFMGETTATLANLVATGESTQNYTPKIMTTAAPSDALASAALVQKVNADTAPKVLARQSRSSSNLPDNLALLTSTDNVNEVNPYGSRVRTNKETTKRTNIPLYSRTSFANNREASSKNISSATYKHMKRPTNESTATYVDIQSTDRRHDQKSPRMVQRLVAGHIENAQKQTTDQLTNTTANRNGGNTKSTIAIKYPSRLNHYSQNDHFKVKSNTENHLTNHNPNNDEALLGDTEEYDNWDNGILRLSAGSGKEKSLKLKKSKDDSKKTLADQVRDGKYGLIEKELFRKPPKRPGILSYLPNKEVPHDNEHNYGGLNEEDIWLAEDHLLVIKGGSLNEDHPEEPWPAIDDYVAPGRQIKIPANPKVPPPFPVQLEENGPVQLIGNNKLTIVFPLSNKSLSLYTGGKKAHNSSPESESDDEKNLIARPGAPENVKENQPPNHNSTPPPSWFYHNNKALAKSSLNASHVPPINYSFLGSFPLARNTSLDSSLTNPDDFDEDDPTLYYPPPYSFVYENNYTNPVPPGPLVPGIVVPPSYNQFSRLQKPVKDPKYSAIKTILPSRYRVSVPTTTTSTATSTVRPLTETVFQNAITKISEYTPKTINIVNAGRTSVRVPSTPSATTAPEGIKSVRVPVAVPIPIYSYNFEVSPQSNANAFVSTTPVTNANTENSGKTNPVYYEYFEAKRQPTISNVIDEFLATTPKDTDLRSDSVSTQPAKLYETQKAPYSNHEQQYQRPYHLATSINTNIPTNRAEENVVIITPKPETRYNHRPIYKGSPPFENFEQEVNALRQKIQFYQNQELRENNIPRTPKTKSMFEYNFESVKSKSIEDKKSNFQPPNSFDGEPFKPMVTYSPLINDEDAFQAINVDKVDGNEVTENENNVKHPTTTLLPVSGPTRFKKLRLRAKYLHQTPPMATYQQATPLEYDNAQHLPPAWVAVNNKKELTSHVPYQSPTPILNNRNRDFTGYYYPSAQQQRLNNRFYDEPFYNLPNRQVFKYRTQQPLPEPVWSLENDTYVNYAPNRPPINPDAEFINPYQTVPINRPYQVQRLPALPMPAFSHQSQYFAPAQRHPSPPPQGQLPRQYQQSSEPLPGHPLHRDILVNYRQPIPPVNPDSEFIVHPQVTRNNLYRPEGYRLPSSTGNENSNVYYITPKYRRANNINNNSNSQQFNKNKSHSEHTNGNYGK